MGRSVTRANVRATLTYTAIGILLVIVVALLGRDIDHHIRGIEAWIAELGAWGPIVFIILLLTATSILIPDTVLCVIAGALFGMAWGTAAVVAGSLLGSALQYALARRLLRPRIERVLAARPSLAAIQRAVTQDEVRLQLLIRLTPLNPATISYVLGATGVRFAGFMVACLALVPNLVIEVYFGHAGKHLARAATGTARTSHLHDMAIIGGVVLCAVVMIVISTMARRRLMAGVSASEPAAP